MTPDLYLCILIFHEQTEHPNAIQRRFFCNTHVSESLILLRTLSCLPIYIPVQNITVISNRISLTTDSSGILGVTRSGDSNY